MMAGEVGTEVGVEAGVGLATCTTKDNKKPVGPGNGSCTMKMIRFAHLS